MKVLVTGGSGLLGRAVCAEVRAGGFDDLKLKPIATADYPTPARRPGNSVFDCTKLERAFGIRQADWRTELDSVLSMLARDSRA